MSFSLSHTHKEISEIKFIYIKNGYFGEFGDIFWHRNFITIANTINNDTLTSTTVHPQLSESTTVSKMVYSNQIPIKEHTLHFTVMPKPPLM